MGKSHLAGVVLALVLAASGAWGKTPSEEAKEHYLAGTKLFNLTQYDEAIKEFEGAYKAVEDPVFLYNIAQSHRLAGHLEKAVRFYRNFLRVVPETPLRAEISGRIAEMEKALEVQGRQQNAPPLGTIGPGEPAKPVEPETKPEVKPETKPEAPAAAPSSGRTLLVVGIGVAAVGVLVAVGGGVGFGLAADGKAAQIKDQETRGVPFEPSTDADRKQFQTLAIVSWVVGGVVAAAGGVLAVLGARGGKAEPAHALRVAPLIGSQACGLSLAGAF